MNPLLRIVRATRACYRRQIELRRDLMIFSVWLLLIVMLGDDFALWLLGHASADARAAVAGSGGGWTTFLFGGLPALALTVAMFHRDWRDCWRNESREVSE